MNHEQYSYQHNHCYYYYYTTAAAAAVATTTTTATTTFDFYRAMHVVLARYCYRKSSVRPSVRPSVCLSVYNVAVR